jgi:hypothetical protein
MSDNGGEGPSIRPLNQAPADTYTYVAPTEGSHWDKLNLLSLGKSLAPLFF